MKERYLCRIEEVLDQLHDYAEQCRCIGLFEGQKSYEIKIASYIELLDIIGYVVTYNPQFGYLVAEGDPDE